MCRDQVPRRGVGALDDIDLSTGRVVHTLGRGVKGPDYLKSSASLIHTYKSMDKMLFWVVHAGQVPQADAGIW